MELVKESIVGAITNLGQSIINGIKSVIEFLFIPSNNLFNDVEVLFKEKFGFVYQVISIGEDLKNIEFGTDTPHFSITLYGKTFDFIDFSFYDKYRSFIHNITLVIAYFGFIIWLLHQIPGIIGGITNGERFVSHHHVVHGTYTNGNTY